MKRKHQDSSSSSDSEKTKDIIILNFIPLLKSALTNDEDDVDDVSSSSSEDDEVQEIIPPSVQYTGPIQLVDIDRNITSLTDLIELGKSYRFDPAVRYSIDMTKLVRLIGPLERLDNLIGMNSVKRTILSQMIFFLAGLTNNDEFMHTIIEGPPGCGKTTVAMILAEIYHALGFVTTNKFKIVKRSDLVAGYLGQTTLKTQKAINEAMGGVLFIDEAYSLGHPEGRDSFSKEIIDTLNQNLSENKGKFICIIAGYKKELDNCFFSMNPGLKRRFPFCYTIEAYTGAELRQIFIKKIRDDGWDLEETKIKDRLFEKNIEYFQFSGGDMETLLHMTKIAHSQRVFGKHSTYKKIISIEDLTIGLEVFKKNATGRTKPDHPEDRAPPFGMYT